MTNLCSTRSLSLLLVTVISVNCKSRTFSDSPKESNTDTNLGAQHLESRMDQGDFILAKSKTGNLYFGMFAAAQKGAMSLVPGFSVNNPEIADKNLSNALNSEFSFAGTDEKTNQVLGEKKGLLIRDFETNIALINTNCELEFVKKLALDKNRYKILGEDFLTFSDDSGKRELPKSLDANVDEAIAKKFGFNGTQKAALSALKLDRFEAETVLVGGENITFRNKDNEFIEGRFIAAQPTCLFLETNEAKSDKNTTQRRGYSFIDIQMNTLRSVPHKSDTTQNEKQALNWEGIEAFTDINNYETQLNLSTFRGTQVLAQQGYKIYVAATQNSAQAVAKFVLPYLVNLGVQHQIRKDFLNFDQETTPESKGKLITIFANSTEEARILAEKIDGHFRDFPVNFTKVEEFTIGRTGILSARFQAFKNDYNGRLVYKDGEYPKAPERGTLKPDWVENPFEGL